MAKVKKQAPKFNKVLIVIIGIIIAFSSSVLSFQLIQKDNYTRLNVYITLIVSFICSLIVYKHTYKNTLKLMKENKLLPLIGILLSAIILKKLYDTKASELINIINFNFPNIFRIRYFILAFFSLTYYLTIILNTCKNWIIDFYHTMDDFDKKAYIISTIVCICLIIITYALVPGFYESFDDVFSIDSGAIVNGRFTTSTYYEIQHPLLVIFNFPIYVVISASLKGYISGNIYYNVIAVLFQIINSQFLILTGLLIKKLSNKKIVYILYMLSFATLTYIFFIEKYQICVFFLVLYVYTLCTKKEKSTAPLIMASGTILTSTVMGVGELIVKDKFVNKIKKIIKIVLIAVLTYICLGNGHLLFHLFDEFSQPLDDFAYITYPFHNHLISTINMIQSSFAALPSVVSDCFLWFDLVRSITLLAICIFAVIIIGVFVSRKKLFNKINTCWLIFAFILFCVLNWSVNISPLFNIYFSWTLIPLFVEGADYIIKKIKLNRNIFYFLFIIYISAINLSTLLSIAKFLLTLY